ncbi:MAG: FAD-dependent oxidoreductase, partial [Paludibacteraceae bacterium]|nr:FAD-dependent oxidoreductase [Paludibacteraceae bacterium]
MCILEKHFQVGGCLQTFKRGATTFDTGFHFVGGLSDGQPLNRLFKYFDLMELPWQKLDDKAFAEVILNGESYNLAQGYEAFVESLTQKFPHQRQELKNYVSLLSNVEKNIESIFDIKAGEEHKASDYFGQSAYQFLNDNFSDKKLIDVVSGASLTMELSPDTLPLYVFAQINNSFIKSSWRLKNG